MPERGGRGTFLNYSFFSIKNRYLLYQERRELLLEILQGLKLSKPPRGPVAAFSPRLFDIKGTVR